MRGITKTLPGRQGARQCQPDGARRRDPRRRRRERRGQVDADEGAERRLPARQLRGRDPLRGRDAPLQRHRRQRARAASSSSTRSWRWCRCCRSPRTSSSATSAPALGVIDWHAAYRARRASCCAKVGLKESPATLVTDLGVGKQQLVEIAKALSKEVQAADPRRADREPERDRQRGAAATCCSSSRRRASPAS